jgi:pilus assembly protein Flp/PilA
MTRRAPRLRRFAHFAGKLARSRRGASAIEYGFLLALIALASFVALSQFADTTQLMWGNIRARVTTATQGS